MKSLKTSLIGKVMLFFNILALMALLASYAAPYLDPGKYWFIAFFGLLYPIFLILNLGFVILWIIRGKAYFLISLAFILLGFFHVISFIQLNPLNRPLPQTGLNLHVCSYNVRVFDLYNYGPKWTLNFTNRNNIYKYLERNDFDLICFQEFVQDKSGKFKTIDTIPRFMRTKYYHVDYSITSRDVNQFGLATFSAYPIVRKERIQFPNNTGNMCIVTDIKTPVDTIRVYNVHFESIGLSQEDFLFVESLTNIEQRLPKDEIKSQGGRILRRMIRAYRQRAIQARLVADHITQSPYPVILAGDFNDTPVSYVYRHLNRHLSDAFQSGRGIGQTYNGKFPGLRIDYIMHSTDFKPYNFRTANQHYSDHFPVSVWLHLADKP